MWLVRDRYNQLFLYTSTKPLTKCPGDTDNYYLNGARSVELPSRLNPEVKWGDGPVEVKLVEV